MVKAPGSFAADYGRRGPMIRKDLPAVPYSDFETRVVPNYGTLTAENVEVLCGIRLGYGIDQVELGNR
ncbi:uncharacterized protein METZ01_LOCUS480002 [marine metagenome]|uniref:Uncharacterized protein n=1 Tax=marine metagenome TaxID=408172 RepID=A0A383C6D0_9ZZZZ